MLYVQVFNRNICSLLSCSEAQKTWKYLRLRCSSSFRHILGWFFFFIWSTYNGNSICLHLKVMAYTLLVTSSYGLGSSTSSFFRSFTLYIVPFQSLFLPLEQSSESHEVLPLFFHYVLVSPQYYSRINNLWASIPTENLTFSENPLFLGLFKEKALNTSLENVFVMNKKRQAVQNFPMLF